YPESITRLEKTGKECVSERRLQGCLKHDMVNGNKRFHGEAVNRRFCLLLECENRQQRGIK
ncbi:hypothetical protein, partial [Enterococcus faecalis]|uniref:hypothetical protein n=1 Tax=Enterococcus faecalis TaxID=1351 RepID=UPI00404180C2